MRYAAVQASTLMAALAICLEATPARAETIVVEDAQLTWVDDVEIASRDAGIIKHVAVQPNDQVAADSVLIKLDDATRAAAAKAAEQRWSIALEESESEIDAKLAKKRVEVTKSALDRGQTALEKYRGAISRAELDRLELEYEQAILAEEQAEHEAVVNKINAALRSSEYELAQIQWKHRTILSPLAGQVVDVPVQAGQWVDEGEPVARVVNTEKLRIVALMPERYIYSVSRGQTAAWQMKVDELTVTAKGRVSFVSPEVNPVNREFTMWVDVDNIDGRLRSGFVGTLTLESKSAAAR